MPQITTDYCELTPAHGRDEKNKKAIEQLFRDGKDFQGDYNLGFKLCSVRDFASGTKVLLRYKQNTQVAVVVV
jgi:hypothetical protein